MGESAVKLMTVEQAKNYYNLSRPTIIKIAEENGALRRIGRALRVDFQKLDTVLDSQKTI